MPVPSREFLGYERFAPPVVPEQKCGNCGGEIKIMIFKNTGSCCTNCGKAVKGEAPIPAKDVPK